MKRLAALCLGLGCCLAALAGPPAPALAQDKPAAVSTGNPAAVDVDAVRRDLQKLDAHVYGGGVSGSPGGASLESGGGNDDFATQSAYQAALTSRKLYQDYLARAARISEGLLLVRKRFNDQLAHLPPGSEANPQFVLSLQELGALSQSLSAQNIRFQGSFQHGEASFQSYKLIQTAIASLEDAIAYWRLTNRYQDLFRSESREHDEDEEVLKLKLETALTAIDELQKIDEMRQALKQLDLAPYP